MTTDSERRYCVALPKEGKMTDRQARMIADHFMYYVKPEERARLMRELPEAYNAYVGREVCIVKIVTDDGERVA